ncbi:hypothetical protein D8674_021128 [Pyrus ussuriensis x Pyrus communis]|uniref:Uncharacterized protein n=1 Tax=Pyrus ussuriensis x Pyrus communis TaxID=2448454 RepID=A0A5N5HPT6_9ROSA|nr:hypothetical protein D8674_021128 [Pyrus ussuriensis x Pyrus communis]
MRSGAKYASKSLKYSFKGNFERIGKTNECNVELLNINKNVKFGEADDVMLLVMLVSSFRIVSCGALYLGSFSGLEVASGEVLLGGGGLGFAWMD